MTNPTTTTLSDPDSTAMNLHASEVVAGQTKKIIVRNSTAAIARVDADALIQQVNNYSPLPTNVHLPSSTNPSMLTLTYPD